MAAGERAAERQALITHNAALSAQALAPGSALACLETAAGADKACELAVFATAQSTAAATMFVTERLKVLAAAEVLAKRGDRDVLAAFATERADLAQDRFGLVAHVLARRYGCRPDHCDELAWLADPSTVKAHLAARPFEALVAGYARLWDRTGETPPAAAASVASAPTAGPVASAGAPEAPAPAASAVPAPAPAAPAGSSALAKAEPAAPHPLDPKWKLPSAASIPAISIMAPEPKLPKVAAEPDRKADEQKADASPPLPPKRPQDGATPAAQAR
jgi:hypothetical protein